MLRSAVHACTALSRSFVRSLVGQCSFVRWTMLVCSLDLFNAELSPERYIVQELCDSPGGRPGLSVLTSLLVSVDVKNY